MTKHSDPTKDSEFKRVLGNLLSAPPKPHSEMKLGKPKGKRTKSPKRKGMRGKTYSPKAS
jgi:hypothetical protein